MSSDVLACCMYLTPPNGWCLHQVSALNGEGSAKAATCYKPTTAIISLHSPFPSLFRDSASLLDVPIVPNTYIDLRSSVHVYAHTYQSCSLPSQSAPKLRPALPLRHIDKPLIASETIYVHLSMIGGPSTARARVS